jgi:hypothetical protein
VPTYTPFVINPGSGNGLYYGDQNGAFPYNGSYIIFVQDSSGNVLAMKSTDAVNWTEVDAAHHLINVRGPARYWDGASSTVTLLYNVQSDSSGALTLITFDLGTETWGAPFAPGGPTGADPKTLSQRPDGSFIAIYRDSPAVIGYFAVVWTGFAWEAPVSLMTNIAALPGFANLTGVGPVTSIVDSTGILHAIMNTFGHAGTPTWINRYFYQQVLPTNALGNFHDFTEQQNTPQGIGGQLGGQSSASGAMQIVGGQLLWGVFRPTSSALAAFPAVYVGTPLAAPVWTAGNNIDSQFTTGAGLAFAGQFSFPSLKYDTVAAILYAVWSRCDGVGNNDQIAMSTQSTGNFATGAWSATQLLYDGDLGGGNFAVPFYPELVLQSGTSGTFVGWAADLSGFDGDEDEQRVFAGVPLPGPPVVTTVPVQPGPVGGLPASVTAALALAGLSAALSPAAAWPAPDQIGLAIGGCKKLNDFDNCVLAEILRTRKIKYPPMCIMPAGVDPFSMPWDEDFGFLPKQCVPFNRSSGILTPASGADQVVLSFRVPTGMDGLLSGLWMGYSGAGFLQGSGDIIFRVQRNQVFLKDLSNCPFLLGNPKQPVSMTQGALLLSGQLVRLIVNVPNLSGLIQVGQSTVSGGLIGFWWARG